MQSMLKQQAHILDEKTAAVQLFGQVRASVLQLSQQQQAFEVRAPHSMDYPPTRWP